MNKTTFSLTLFLFLALMSSGLVAQQALIIGKIIDDSGQPLEFSSITLLQSADSTMVTGVSADISGNFEISSNPGEFILRVDFMGFQTVFRDLQVDNSPMNLGTIQMNMDGQFLDEVTITAAQQLFKSDIESAPIMWQIMSWRRVLPPQSS